MQRRAEGVVFTLFAKLCGVDTLRLGSIPLHPFDKVLRPHNAAKGGVK